MTRANAIGLAIVFEAKNGQQLLVRVTELFTEFRQTLDYFLEKNGGLACTIEPSLAKHPYGAILE